MNATKLISFLLMISLVFGFTSLAEAELDFKKYEGWGFSSASELKALPEFCIARFSFYGDDKRLYNKWHNIIGDDFIHFHHFCRGLTLLKRGYSETNNKKRAQTLQTALKEMKYTATHTSKKLNLKWRIIFHQNIGKAYLLMGQSQEANLEFQKAKTISERIKQ